MNLSGRSFRLIENPNGRASVSTTIRFADESYPIVATYPGPNIVRGQAIVVASDANEYEMIYQALMSDGKLVAGKAMVSLYEDTEQNEVMKLEWEWLTGDRSSGVSRWVEIVDS